MLKKSRFAKCLPCQTFNYTAGIPVRLDVLHVAILGKLSRKIGKCSVLRTHSTTSELSLTVPLSSNRDPLYINITRDITPPLLQHSFVSVLFCVPAHVHLFGNNHDKTVSSEGPVYDIYDASREPFSQQTLNQEIIAKIV